ncbi:MAG TPA: polyprenol monophosphomannose synthase [Thermoleophilaceae bacterium]|nr:polyprenol monophosphomannose synthase [Thermoleophilaceae bacterium]
MTPATVSGAATSDARTGTAWVVLPTFNEAENIESIAAAIVEVLDVAAPEAFRVLIVDDDSPDGTGAIADRLAAEHPSIEVLHRTNREGLGPAYVAGFRRALAAGAAYVIEMDADGSHDPRDLVRLLAAVRDGDADLALGSRYVDGGRISDWGVVRRATSWGGCWYARVVLGLRLRDVTGGFKCFAAEVLDAIDLGSVRARGYAFQVELTHRTVRGGFRVQEIPITFRDRERGHSKMSWRIAVEAAWLVPQLRWGRGRPRTVRHDSHGIRRITPVIASPMSGSATGNPRETTIAEATTASET